MEVENDNIRVMSILVRQHPPVSVSSFDDFTRLTQIEKQFYIFLDCQRTTNRLISKNTEFYYFLFKAFAEIPSEHIREMMVECMEIAENHYNEGIYLEMCSGLSNYNDALILYQQIFDHPSFKKSLISIVDNKLLIDGFV
jgi:hypothetical protein